MVFQNSYDFRQTFLPNDRAPVALVRFVSLSWSELKLGNAQSRANERAERGEHEEHSSRTTGQEREKDWKLQE